MDLELTTPPFEVRCEACNCSFAAGTKQCVHCGGRLGGGFDFAQVAAGRADTDGAEAAGRPSIGRFLVWAVSAGVALLAHLANTCAER